MSPKILVIKHGALGDFIQATGPFKSIRKYHSGSHITLLTTESFASLASETGWFDEIWVDDRVPWYRIKSWLLLRRQLVSGGFGRIYDLQTSDRSGWYFRHFSSGGRPEWSGIVSGCSHPHSNPLRNSMHTIERQAEQLKMAGINKVYGIDVNWLRGDITSLDLSGKRALLVPGGAKNRKDKRWPVACFSSLANRFIKSGMQVCLIGDATELELQQAIAKNAPEVVQLAGETSLGQVATLARCSHIAVGNDTGPMHIVAASGAPTLVLFGGASDPSLCAPRGLKVKVLETLEGSHIKNLSLQVVWEAVQHFESPN